MIVEVLPRHNRGAGTLYVFGCNVSGQFGFGFEVVDKRKYPALVPDLQALNIQVSNSLPINNYHGLATMAKG